MSTNYMLLKKAGEDPTVSTAQPTVQEMAKIPAADFFDGRLAVFGVSEHVNENTTERSRCLTDGNNCMWVYIDDNGRVSDVTRYAPGGAPGKILNAIAEAFDVDIVSEHEPQFWGFATQEEWDAWMEKLSREHADQFYAEFLQYLRDGTHHYDPSQNGAKMMETGKKLVENDPSLLLPENKDKLLDAMDSCIGITGTFSPEDIALIKMIATHEDDLPSA